jgi:ligand-binding SRPBCC domain-containing protein
VTVTIDLTTDIDAPVDVVFDLARDLDLHARSMAHTGERAVAGRTSGRIGAGETVTWRARHFGIWWSLTSRITVVEPPTRFQDIQERGPFAWFRHEHTFESRSDGGTHMLDRWEHRSPLGPLGWLADRLILTGHMRRLLVTRNAVLKREAESAASTGSRRRRLGVDGGGSRTRIVPVAEVSSTPRRRGRL